ncbi:hypothetical protein EJ02DRAFT_469878 [Clathrospora elynae]|uniref:Uncharacterized protein n=1 Tax=Clathrospora elynae TaxID=706981 RepID=A0A6A5SBZ4_9PLEO|nr:hypothetical protein EJ02DRAFT_469878 [Clathrospora elynae]
MHKDTLMAITVMRPAVETTKDTVYVNVGKPVSSSRDMCDQSIKGAVWVSANLLEIIPDQPTSACLCPQNAADMILMALRQSGHNAGLIGLEGLGILGIKCNQQHLKSMEISTGQHLIKFGASISPQLAIAAWNLRDLRTLGMDLNEKPYNEGLARLQSLDKRLQSWFPETNPEDCTVFVLENRRETKYITIKRAGDITFGRHSLCVTGGKIKIPCNTTSVQSVISSHMRTVHDP